MNAEFQRIARRVKKAFLNDQCKEIEENNRMGNTRDLFKKTRDSKGTYTSIITLNVNRLNAPNKRYRLAEGIQKQDPYIYYLQETHFRPKDTYRLKMRRWENIFYANGKQMKAGVAILISDKIDLKI